MSFRTSTSKINEMYITESSLNAHALFLVNKLCTKDTKIVSVNFTLKRERQFGFINNKSTIATDSLISQILDSFESGHDTYTSFLGFTKAFFCVSHDILLEKLWF